MALKGTLKDFGIADILQLIGQQGKTGTLHLKAKDHQVDVAFAEGNIVGAESATRNKRDLIGNMLVRAELITEAQLEAALDAQKRTLQRLGDVLVSQRAIDAEKFKQMVQLQITETLYKLFTWKSGNYAFEQGEVEIDPSFTPLRAESVLMEGFRMVDEWPLVKKRITSYEMTFDRGKELPPPSFESNAFDAALDDALSGQAPEPTSSPDGVGEVERKVYLLAVSGRDVRKIIDSSCLGEFESCKALSNLVTREYLRPVALSGKKSKGGLEGGESLFERAGSALGRALLSLTVLAALGFAATRIDFGAVRVGGTSGTRYTDPAAQRFVSRQQIARIGAAIDMYRLEKGSLPEKLEALVEAGLLQADDLKYPWRDTYFYRRTDAGAFVLLPPLR